MSAMLKFRLVEVPCAYSGTGCVPVQAGSEPLGTIIAPEAGVPAPARSDTEDAAYRGKCLRRSLSIRRCGASNC